MSKNLKKKVPSPYYLSYTAENEQVLDSFIAAILAQGLASFELSNGKLSCKTHTNLSNPSVFLDNIKAILNL
jgi:hypothetical protein